MSMKPRNRAVFDDLQMAATVIENGQDHPVPAAAAPAEPIAAPAPAPAPSPVATPVVATAPAPQLPAKLDFQRPQMPDWAATEEEAIDPGLPLNVRIPTDLANELREFSLFTRMKQKDIVATALRNELMRLKFERAEAARQKALARGQGGK